jgi:flagellar motor protein MotB
MRPIGVMSATALFLLLGIPAPADARQEKAANQEEKAQPPRQEQQAKPEKQQQTQGQQQQRQQQQAQAPKQQQQRQQQAQGQQNQQRQQAQQQNRSSQRPQRTQQEEARQRAELELRLSDRGSGRIPDERFQSNFGREHNFRIGSPVLVGGYSRFQYGGYWFGFVEPWPVGWYYTDDVYIDYVDGGYYMYDPYYPGARFAISVVL